MPVVRVGALLETGAARSAAGPEAPGAGVEPPAGPRAVQGPGVESGAWQKAMPVDVTPAVAPPSESTDAGSPATRGDAERTAPSSGRSERRRERGGQHGGSASAERPTGSCTGPQLRRFIKSRAYVPLHELRRRFSISGDDDDVSPMDVEPGRVYVGLPAYEAGLLSELVRSGDIGYELCVDPETPIVVGVYAMRPVART